MSEGATSEGRRSGRGAILLAGLGSAVLLSGALLFQFVGGLAPCPMCIWQRWPHVFAEIFAVMALTIAAGHARLLSWLGFVTMAVSAGLGLFHAGVEQGWWDGPSTCTSGSIEGLTTDQLLEQIMNAPMVRCDEIAWQFLGISMAGWNGLISAVLAVFWLMAALRR